MLQQKSEEYIKNMTNKPDTAEKLAKKKKFINVILAAFAVCIVVYSVIGALIIDNFSNLMQEEEAFKKKLFEDDEKLKEEASPDEPEEIGSFLANEEVKKTKFDEYNEKYKKKQYKEDTENKNIPSEIKDEQQEQSSGKSLKVVVGNFSTIEEAQTEREKIKSQFSAEPFVKSINGKYTLQVGSFKAHATAEALANSLKQQGYSARIIEE